MNTPNAALTRSTLPENQQPCALYGEIHQRWWRHWPGWEGILVLEKGVGFIWTVERKLEAIGPTQSRVTYILRYRNNTEYRLEFEGNNDIVRGYNDMLTKFTFSTNDHDDDPESAVDAADRDVVKPVKWDLASDDMRDWVRARMYEVLEHGQPEEKYQQQVERARQVALFR